MPKTGGAMATPHIYIWTFTDLTMFQPWLESCLQSHYVNSFRELISILANKDLFENIWKNPKGQSVLSKWVLTKHWRPKGKILALFGDKPILYYCNFDSILSHYNAVFQQFLYFIHSNQKLHLNITDKTWASLGFQTCWCHHFRGHFQDANFALVI